MPNYTKTARKSTRRQRESQRAQAQRERYAALAWLRRLVLIVSFVMLLTSGGVATYLWHDEPVLGNLQQKLTGVIGLVSQKGGLVVKQVLVKGRHDTPPNKVKKALGILPGDPMLFVSLEEARKRLEALPEVRHAALQRHWPDVISIHLQERTPVARWLHGGVSVLIDRDGLILGDKMVSEYGHLILFVGEEITSLAPVFFSMCESEPVLCEQVVAAKRIGGRRWDVRFENDVLAKLPELGARAAWGRLARMEEEQLLSPYLAEIDLRLTDRIFVTKAKGESIVASE